VKKTGPQEVDGGVVVTDVAIIVEEYEAVGIIVADDKAANGAEVGVVETGVALRNAVTATKACSGLLYLQIATSPNKF
jgi:hypothetical protein